MLPTTNPRLGLDVEHDRAITGGAGQFRAGSGVNSQTLDGFNETGGVILGVEFGFTAGAGS